MSLADERRRCLLATVDPTARRGLEIGALDSPVLARDGREGLFADRVGTGDLRLAFADHAGQGVVDLEALVPVDVVVGEGRVAAALGARGPVDYVVASHVIEHVADPIGWLRDLADCLVEDGLVFLVVPDKRFTFDHFRAPTVTRELIEAHLAGARRPTPGQVYDHAAHAALVDAEATWRGEPAAERAHPGANRAAAFGLARTAAEIGHHDVHCTVWTPGGFAEVFGEVIALGLLPLEFGRLEPTRRNRAEFYVTFRKRSAPSAADLAGSTPRLDPCHHELPRRRPLAALLRRAGRRGRHRSPA